MGFEPTTPTLARSLSGYARLAHRPPCYTNQLKLRAFIYRTAPGCIRPPPILPFHLLTGCLHYAADVVL